MSRLSFNNTNPVKTFIFTALSLYFLVFLLVSCKGTPNIKMGPIVEEPVFSITSIKILQAELINTRLKIRIHIENPNIFPLELVSLKYEFYGYGRLWAEGTETNACTIPASGFAEKDLYLIMNFINMRRDLLDRVITMRNIRYRFTGTAEIRSETAPVFSKAFNLEGEAEVEQ